MNTFDVAIIGLGANGSAAAYQLAKAGVAVLGIDRYAPPHTHGSSHGESRIIRQAYHESPMYVPLVQEAYKLWDELEERTGKKLLLPTGGVVLGTKDAATVKGAQLSVQMHNLPHEVLNQEQISTWYPALKPTADTIAVWDKTAGVLFPEDCIRAFLGEAQKGGAKLLYNQQVTGIKPQGNSVTITTATNTYTAARVILSAGAWMNHLLPDLKLPLTVERQVLFWFANKQFPRDFTPEHLPIYIWEYGPHKVFYGFPDLGSGIKTAFHHDGEIIAPDALKPDVSPSEIKSMTEVVGTYLNVKPEVTNTATCLYTNTPDGHFIIDVHPVHRNVIVASPCSGHGFKFASVTGKLLCDMALGQKVSFDLSPFRIGRF